eukprot:6204902-Pleurochrysis_carterae.AAC.1
MVSLRPTKSLGDGSLARTCSGWYDLNVWCTPSGHMPAPISSSVCARTEAHARSHRQPRRGQCQLEQSGSVCVNRADLPPLSWRKPPLIGRAFTLNA